MSSTLQRGLERRAKEGRVFALGLEELVGFLLVGNVNHNSEVEGEQVPGGLQVVWFGRSTKCLEAEAWELELERVERNFNLINLD